VVVEEDSASTFAVLARRYIKEHAQTRTKRWQQTARLLGLRHGDLDEVIPGGIVAMWGTKLVGDVTVGDVRDVVYQAQHDVTPGAEKASRRNGQSDSAGRSMVRTLSKFFNWAVEHGKVEVSPVAGVKAPRPGQARDRVLTDDEIRKFWNAIGEEPAEFSAPLKLLLLTGCRVNEVAGMRRSELSEDLSVWTIPGARTKNKKTHVVPLPQLARDILLSAYQEADGDCVFSTTGGRLPVQLGTRVKRKLDARMGIPPWVLHDLRRTAVTNMVDLGVSTHVVELVVNHVSGTLAGVAGIYNRATMMTDRKAALERWASHVNGIVTGRQANVVTMRSAS
jgi:integrase